MIEKMYALHGLRTNPDYPVYPFKMSLLLSSYPLIISERRFCTGSKETAEQDPVRKHGAQEEKAAKASLLGFAASTSGAGFEQPVFSMFTCAGLPAICLAGRWLIPP